MDVNLQDVNPIMNVTAEAKAIFPISPVAANTPMSFPMLSAEADFATAEKATGWNMPKAMLPKTNERNTVNNPVDKPRIMNPVL